MPYFKSKVTLSKYCFVNTNCKKNLKTFSYLNLSIKVILVLFVNPAPDMSLRHIIFLRLEFSLVETGKSVNKTLKFSKITPLM